MASASQLMELLQQRWTNRDDTNKESTDHLGGYEDDEQSHYGHLGSRRQLGFFEGLQFLFGDEKLSPQEFPSHIFGIPTNLCTGDFDECSTGSQGSTGSGRGVDKYNEYDDDAEDEVRFSPRGRDFQSDLSTILEVATALSRQNTGSSLESNATFCSKQNKCIVTGWSKGKAKDGNSPLPQSPVSITDLDTTDQHMHSTAAYKEAEHLLAKSTSSKAEDVDLSGNLEHISTSLASISEEGDVAKVLMAILSLDSDGEPKEGQYSIQGPLGKARDGVDKVWSFGETFSSSNASSQSKVDTNQESKDSGVASKKIVEGRGLLGQLSGKKVLLCRTNVASADKRNEMNFPSRKESVALDDKNLLNGENNPFICNQEVRYECEILREGMKKCSMATWSGSQTQSGQVSVDSASQDENKEGKSSPSSLDVSQEVSEINTKLKKSDRKFMTSFFGKRK